MYNDIRKKYREALCLMKRIKLLTIILFLLVPLSVFAKVENPSYDITNVYSSIEIDMIGSLHVREAIIVKGSLNGFRRSIEYKNKDANSWQPGDEEFENTSFYNARGVSLKKASAKKIEKDNIGWNLLNATYDDFEKKDYAEVGEEKAYTITKNTNGEEYKIFNENKSGYMVYYFEYFIDQAVVLHNDVAELYYTVFELDEDVDDLNIQITTQGSSDKDHFRVWAHGSINGSLSPIKTDDDSDTYKGAVIKVDDYKKEDVVEIRMLFDKSLVSLFSTVLNDSETDALERIEQIEQKKYDEADKEKKYIKTVFYSFLVITTLYIIFEIILWIHMYRKYDKEYKVNFDHKYYREFTGDYDVEVVDYLMKKDVTIDALNASIMNLIYKKYIEIEENPGDKKNITLVLKSREKVNPAEKILIELLFDLIGKDEKVTLNEIKNYSKKYETADLFIKKYTDWQLAVKTAGKKEEFFEEQVTPKMVGICYFILGLVIICLMMCFRIEIALLYIATFIGGISFAIYTLSFKKWTKKGREHYLKWTAFKQFLLDFGSFKDKEIPEIALWDKYLVYATVFGIAKQVEKAMKIHLSSMNIDDTTITPGVFYYRDFYISNQISGAMSSAHTNSITTINMSNVNSTIGGGSGFGGGFGGGGGSAGGGGGGGGF